MLSNVVRCVLLVVYWCVLFVVCRLCRRLVLSVYCRCLVFVVVLCVVCCLMVFVGVRCLWFVFCCLLLCAVCCVSSFVDRLLLFVVCCSMVVV